MGFFIWLYEIKCGIHFYFFNHRWTRINTDVFWNPNPYGVSHSLWHSLDCDCPKGDHVWTRMNTNKHHGFWQDSALKSRLMVLDCLHNKNGCPLCVSFMASRNQSRSFAAPVHQPCWRSSVGSAHSLTVIQIKVIFEIGSMDIFDMSYLWKMSRWYKITFCSALML